jgi:hypothetical protein
LLITVSLLLPQQGSATSEKDVKIAVRVLDFVNAPAVGRSVVGVVFDARNRDSIEDARSILQWLGGASGQSISDMTPVLIDIRKLDSFRDLGALVVAAGLEESYDRIRDYGSSTHTLTISTDLACVRAAKCVVAVSSVPRVEVMISARAASDSGVHFSDAFRMMVTEY